MTINMGKKQSYKNIALNITAFALQFIISFYISPIIVGKIGTTAYGFIGLANDFILYISILATIFNSVAARFIAKAIYKEEYDKANSYFNSLILTNLIISAIIGISGILIVTNIDSLFTIPIELVIDVKITFTIIFVSYIISLITLVFTTSTFITNRTDIQGIRNMINYIIKFALIIIFLNFISIKIYWIALATMIATTVVAIMNVGLTKRLTPELKINIKFVKREAVKELAKSGSWMALTSISTILLRGLDLTIANIMIGDYEMGLLSIARTIPNNITSIIATIAPIFTPVFLSLYTKNNISELIKNIKKTIEIMAIIIFVPISGFVVFSYDFYSLWQKSLSENELMVITILSSITVVQAYFNSTTSTMAQISVVVNKLKTPVIISLGCGVLSFIVEIVLIKYTSLGLYAIVISTSVIMIIRYVLFNSIYAAYCLNQNKKCFLWTVIKSWLLIPILIFSMIIVKINIPINSWIDLIKVAILCGIIGYLEVIIYYRRNSLRTFLCRYKK